MLPLLQIPVQLIAIHGKAGSGKDTVANYLYEKYWNCWAAPFAGPLKEAAVEAFGIDREYFDNQDLKEVPHSYWGVSPRKIAQFMGTQMFRDMIINLLPHVGRDFWIMRHAGYLDGRASNSNEATFEQYDTVTIPDLRFQNEYDYVMANNGIVIHLTRPGKDGTVGIPGHLSEADISLHTTERTYAINNSGTLEDLYKQVDFVINKCHLSLRLKTEPMFEL